MRYSVLVCCVLAVVAHVQGEAHSDNKKCFSQTTKVVGGLCNGKSVKIQKCKPTDFTDKATFKQEHDDMIKETYGTFDKAECEASGMLESAELVCNELGGKAK